MANVFITLFLVSFLILIVGLIKPSYSRVKSRKQVLYVFGGATLLFFILIAITVPHPQAETSETPTVSASNTTIATSSSAAPITTITPQQYKIQVADIEKIMLSDMQDLGTFLIAHPSIQNWSQEDISYREGQATEIKLAYRGVQQITPPDSLKDFHAETLKGLSDITNGMDLLIAGIDNVDNNKIKQADALLVKGKGEIDAVNQKLNASIMGYE